MDEVFNSKNNNLCSLNVLKKFHKLDQNIFMVHKGVVNFKNNQLVCFIFNQKLCHFTIYLVNNKQLDVKHKVVKMSKMTFPWITFLRNVDLLTVNSRIYQYYHNSLLVV